MIIKFPSNSKKILLFFSWVNHLNFWFYDPDLTHESEFKLCSIEEKNNTYF